MAVSKGRETKKDTPDLPLNINKVGIKAKEGGITIRSLPIEREVDLSSYSLERLSNWPNRLLIFIFK